MRRAGLSIAVFLSLSAQPIAAQSSPVSALADATQIPTLLLDDPSQIWRFPQTLSTSDRMIWAQRMGAGTPSSLGGVIHQGGARLAVGSAIMSGTFWDSRNKYFAVATPDWPIAIGIMAGFDRNETEREDMVSVPGSNYSSDSTTRSEARQLGVGLQRRGDGYRTLLSGMLHDVDFDSDARQDDITTGSHRNSKNSYTLALRHDQDLPRDLQIRGAVAFSEGDVEEEFLRSGPSDMSDNAHSYFQQIHAAVGLWHFASPHRQSSVHVSFAKELKPLLTNFYGNDRKSTTVDRSTALGASASVLTPLLDPVDMLAGFSIRWQKFERERTYDSPLEIRLDRNSGENWYDQFAWGLRATYRQFQLTGSVASDLALADPFIALDAVVSF